MKTTKHCFVIDDDADDQEIFQMCVNTVADHITFSSAVNGVEALSMLQSIPHYTPDYIFIDINMPKMNGIECLRKIKEIDRLKHSRVFMYSTTAEKAVVNEAKNLGADDFIVKPVRTIELKERLSLIFGTALK